MATADLQQQTHASRKDHLAATKMNYCHYVVTQLTGYILHPKIDVDKAFIRIADIGTETAVWPINLAESLPPTAAVDGFDLSKEFFPPEQWLPKNMKLHVQDAFEPFPHELQRKYDVAHLRWFLALPKTKVGPLIRNVMTLLKPGGYIQWTEHDKSSVSAVTASQTLSMEATQQLVNLERMPFPDYEADWLSQIPLSMREEGLNIVAYDRIPVRDSLRTQLNQVQYLALSDVPVGASKTIDDFRGEYMGMLKEEFSRGVSTAQDFICIVAQTDF